MMTYVTLVEGIEHHHTCMSQIILTNRDRLIGLLRYSNLILIDRYSADGDGDNNGFIE